MGSINPIHHHHHLHSRSCLLFLAAALCLSSILVVNKSHATSQPSDMSTAILIRVDQSGAGDFKKIQDAIDSVPSHNTELVFIWIKPGTYSEKIVIPADKPFITLSGTTPSNTIITWGDGGDIFESPTLAVLAADFVGRFLTIRNTHEHNTKAVALRVSADRVAFYGCRILAYQDTLLDDFGRHYYNNCYIEGAIDFICGNAASLFEKCRLHSIADGTGIITAQRRMSPSENTGFTFLGCRVTAKSKGTVLLGRPWGTHSRVVFAQTYMAGGVLPPGWNDWGDSSKQRTVFYGQHKCWGSGANVSGRVRWSRVLSDKEAAPFMTKDMIGGRGWLRPPPTHFKRGNTISSSHINSKF